MKELTIIQESVLEFIKEHLVNFHNMPTMKEIADKMGWKSPNTAHGHVKALVKKGALHQFTDGSGKFCLEGFEIKLEATR